MRDEDPNSLDFTDDEAVIDTADCPTCGKAIYEDAERCPHCGTYVSNEDGELSDAGVRKQPWWIILGLILLLLSCLTMVMTLR